MQPNMAQVLNTLAHEIRTPLAVSQGYLKLYVDGRLTTPADQQRALQQTREALGVIAVLCSEMTKVSALAEATDVAMVERLDLPALATQLQAASELGTAEWGDVPAGAGNIATNAPKDLVRAVAVMLKAAFDEDKGGPHRVEFSQEGDTLVLRAGTPDALRLLARTPDGPGAIALNVVRGGKGLSLIWATFVANQHRIQTWSHDDHKASVGLRIPLVTV
jgi:signal transduction histidine kinase